MCFYFVITTRHSEAKIGPQLANNSNPDIISFIGSNKEHLTKLISSSFTMYFPSWILDP